MAQQTRDVGTNLQLIHAMEAANDRAEQARQKVAQAQVDLVGGWTGVASQTFSDGIGEWLQGLAKVKAGLSKLQESMNQVARLTQSTEDDNKSKALAGAINASWT
jgi:WXG100 family type VII secretion target